MSDPSRHGLRGDQPGHDHSWHLEVGTGLHAPFGRLVRDPNTGEACCHLCGRWFRALGSHVRAHGYSGAEYRRAMGLTRGRSLAAPEVSARIAQRQRIAYRADGRVREHLAIGHELARTGVLTELVRAASQRPRPETAATRLEALDAGRASHRTQRQQRLDQAVREAGASDLADLLRGAYDDGASLDDLARMTGLGHVRLRAALVDAGIAIRPVGTNTPNGRRSRAVLAEQQAARRVGAEDVIAWLAERRAAGAHLADLAEAVGHSIHWVRWRVQPPARSESER